MENGYVRIVKHVYKTYCGEFFLEEEKFPEGFCRQNKESYFIYK
jgi:hypothetical protein